MFSLLVPNYFHISHSFLPTTNVSFEKQTGQMRAENKFQMKNLISLSALPDDTIKSGMFDFEPDYFQEISNSVAVKVHNFSEEKIQALNSKEDLTKHAYSLLFVMRAYNNAALEISWEAVQWAIPHGDSLRSAGDYGRDNPWDEILNYSENAAMDAGWDSRWSEARNYALHFARSSASIVRATARRAVREFVIDAEKNGKSSEEIGRAAFNFAQKISYQYFFENFDNIVENSYSASIDQMANDPKKNIFSSPESWVNFSSQKKYFGNLEDQSRHFFDPWLTELNKITKILDRRNVKDESE